MSSGTVSDREPDATPVIRTEVVDRIGLITLNRPESRNALNSALILALDTAVKRMAADDGVKVVILTGAAAAGGTGGFCSGGDVKEGARGAGDAGVPEHALEGDLSRHDRHAAMLLHLMPKPTIAMVGGPAIGAGCSLAAACDLRYASEDAVFAAGFSTNGLSGDYGGTMFWTGIIGSARTRELYLLDARIPARKAMEWGMVNDVVAPDRLRPHTLEIAHRLARTPAPVAALVKDNCNEAELDLARRRAVFGREAENQHVSARATSERHARKRREASGRASPEDGGGRHGSG